MPPASDRIAVRGTTEDLQRLRDFIQRQALSCGFDETRAYHITLAVDEVCSNIIRHSYHSDPSRRIHVAVSYSTNGMEISISDDGASFDPRDVKDPDMKEYFSQFRRGGLGIPIVKKLMDEVQYFPSLAAGSAMNTLVLRKSL